jgi:hypothetical protein
MAASLSGQKEEAKKAFAEFESKSLPSRSLKDNSSRSFEAWVAVSNPAALTMDKTPAFLGHSGEGINF